MSPPRLSQNQALAAIALVVLVLLASLELAHMARKLWHAIRFGALLLLVFLAWQWWQARRQR